MLVAAATEIVGLISLLSKSGRDQEAHWIKVHSFEKDGDALHRAAIGELFDQTTDPAEVIKWKDIHGLIEVAIDRCEDVANIVETIGEAQVTCLRDHVSCSPSFHREFALRCPDTTTIDLEEK